MSALNRLNFWVLTGGMMMAAGLWAAPALAQQAVFVVRHAERLDDSSDSPLSSLGKARAVKLAEHLRDARITAIFVTQYVRTAETARPLAISLGLQLQTIPATQTADLIAQLRALGQNARALVVGHSDTVPKILNALGSAESVSIAPDEYAGLFVVVPRSEAASTILRLRY